MLTECRVSFWGDDNVLQLDRDGGCTTLHREHVWLQQCHSQAPAQATWEPDSGEPGSLVAVNPCMEVWVCRAPGFDCAKM